MGNVHPLIKLGEKKIFWRKHPENDKYFLTKEEDRFIFLRVNNFPEESLFTIIDGIKIYDLEEIPTQWEIES